MNDSQKRVPVTVNLGADQRDRMQQLARAEDRSVSAIVRHALARELAVAEVAPNLTVLSQDAHATFTVS